MGILNVTPDSFYDGGRYLSEVKLSNAFIRIMDEGADMIDVGLFYPSRADYDDRGRNQTFVAGGGTDSENIIRRRSFRSILSGQKAEEIVAAQGPVIVNDISGGTMDEGMFDYVARTGVPFTS